MKLKETLSYTDEEFEKAQSEIASWISGPDNIDGATVERIVINRFLNQSNVGDLTEIDESIPALTGAGDFSLEGIPFDVKSSLRYPNITISFPKTDEDEKKYLRKDFVCCRHYKDSKQILIWGCIDWDEAKKIGIPQERNGKKYLLIKPENLK